MRHIGEEWVSGSGMGELSEGRRLDLKPRFLRWRSPLVVSW
jgi:hypothetical protein